MTKARPRRERSEPEIDEMSWRYLCDASTPEDKERWLYHTLDFDELELAIEEPPTGKRTSELWAEFGDKVVAWWAKERPGTRPRCWWKYSAKEPRRRLGGVGITRRAALGWDEYVADHGLPDPKGWLTLENLNLHPHWQPTAVPDPAPIDPIDPPKFESQAAYLKRLGLLLPGEAARLGVADYKPETIVLETSDRVHAARR
ncbi:hypothetical protein [Bradyrhizobium sp. Ash2021]|uniref:hypothetical protein n=1 Tax=Bradyrhizobium sp. Ash2021 TaxID=2954771 RepID=UPI002814FD62|nr:hypothetical protein [Bradyrhizobium sp. Ash2021]WMT78857.1 hypothetical protein NL528_22035 [Bradyrhizobium sp. Ash2021]